MLEYFRQLSRLRLAVAATLFLLTLTYLYRPSSSGVAHNFPTFPDEDYTYPAHPHHGAVNQAKPKRALVVGAGASGSAAAWFLRRAANVMEDRVGVARGSLLDEIVVVEREAYVGGSTSSTICFVKR